MCCQGARTTSRQRPYDTTMLSWLAVVTWRPEFVSSQSHNVTWQSGTPMLVQWPVAFDLWPYKERVSNQCSWECLVCFLNLIPLNICSLLVYTCAWYCIYSNSHTNFRSVCRCKENMQWHLPGYVCTSHIQEVHIYIHQRKCTQQSEQNINKHNQNNKSPLYMCTKERNMFVRIKYV